MYFSVAGITASPFLVLGVAFALSFVCSMGGITGAFLLLPFQVSVLGYTHPSVSATNQIFNIVATPAGLLRLMRERRIVWPLVLAICLGTFPGVFLGALARVFWLPDVHHFKLFAGVVLAYVGSRLLATALAQKNTLRKPAKASRQAGTEKRQSMGVSVLNWSWRSITYRFEGQVSTCPLPGIFFLSLFVGCIGGAYGIGGGAIIAPFLIVGFGLPIHAITGATLLATFITSLAGVSFYSLLALWVPDVPISPDWGLGALFGVGGLLGVYCGVRCQKYVPAKLLQLGLGVLIIITAFQYIVTGFL